MRTEQELIPFAPGDLPPGPWLVFAPHPDDESFGMGGTLIRAREAGVPVEIVFVTDGSKGGRKGEDPATVAEIRRDEALSACRHLGIRNCYFWQQPDRALRNESGLADAVAALVEKTTPACVYLPSCLELHPDHRTTAHIVWDGLRKVKDFKGDVVAYDICTQGPANLMVDITEVVDEKREVMARYRSQIENGRYIEVIEALDRARTLTLPDECRAAEGFYRYDFSPLVPLEQRALPWFHRFLEKAEGYGAPLVSVIVRTRDRREWLGEALASVAAQDYPRIELVVINDGGENVSHVVEAFGRNLEALKHIRLTESVGRVAAANKGLENAAGDYFLFLDDDDWLDPPHISNLVRTLEADPKALVAYAGVRVTAPGGSEREAFNEPFDRNRMYYENYIPIHAALVSRAVIDAGLRFDESLDVFEDWDFWLQIMQRTIVFLHHDAVTAHYRVNHDQGIGVRGGHDEARRLIYARWSKTWGIAEIDDLLTRLALLSPGTRP